MKAIKIGDKKAYIKFIFSFANKFYVPSITDIFIVYDIIVVQKIEDSPPKVCKYA